MSSAFYPQGMNSYNNRVPQGGYKTWKGSGVYSNPVGVTAGNLRPQTNKDPRNIAVYKHGSARPLKQYRRGTNVPIPTLQNPTTKEQEGEKIESNYYSNNQVKSSVSDRIIGQMIDRPGEFSIKENKLLSPNTIDADCKTCNGVGIVSSWYPTKNLTETPQLDSTNPLLCCNEERKARRRVIYASTNLKKNYYTTTGQYLYNRCQTFDQRAFNFLSGVADKKLYDESIVNNPLVTPIDIINTKPGDPLAYLNLYVANCNPNVEISEAVSISVIDRIAVILNNEHVITSEEYALFLSERLTTIKAFIQFLNDNISDTTQRILALDIAYKIMANANVNGILGPSNQNGCKLVVYKPNNPQFAQQGAVSSSTRILKLNVNTINSNLANIQRLKGDGALSKGVINVGGQPFTPFIYKNKSAQCNPVYYTKNGNPKTCFKSSNDTTTIVTV
jgi:hypothetical protein